MALSLLKQAAAQEDRDGKTRSLRYLRTKEGREVDFVLVQEERPILMVEAKYGEREISPHLRYFRARYPIDAVQVVADLRQEREADGIRVLRAGPWLEGLEA